MRKWWALALILNCSVVWAAIPGVKEFTRDMTYTAGFIPFYYDQASDKVYLQISRFDSPLLFQSSLPYGVGSNDIGLDRGQLGDTRLVQFERYGNKVMLKQLNTRFRAQTDNQAEQNSVQEAFADSVLAGFKIVAGNNDTVLINYTPYLLTDVHGIGVRLEQTGQGSYKADAKRSGVFLPRTKAFEKNTELEALVTFGGSEPGKYVQAVTPDPTSITVHLHHSFIALPDNGYEPRTYHPYSGYWKTSFFDYATGISEPLEQRYITRHRLAKKDVGAKQSEPVEPIGYYLDPGIPEPVMSALKDGASWWNQAFEAAGYNNAFQVKVLPEDADPMDVRYNVIQWVHRATRGWSYGSSVVDPRTGEIIKGHVTLGSLRVRQDYLIALGLTSPFSETPQTDEQQQMALDRIRQLSAHEVGHTLGVAHNFAASEDGRESVMDYPHPQITLNNGKISLANAYDKGMGKWDLHAIAYGYQDYQDKAQEQTGLARQIKQSREAGLSFKTDFDTRSSASASANGHLWENGSDPLQELNKLVRIRERALNTLGLNTLPENRSLSALEDALVPVYLLHRFVVVAAAKQVGGLVYEYEQKGDYDKPKGQQPVAAEIQKQAIKAVLNTTTAEFLRLPESLIRLIPPTAYGDDITREHFNGRMGLPLDPVSAAASAANYSLGLLLNPQRLNRLSWQASQGRGLPGVHALTLRIFEQHWYNNNNADYGLQKRLRMVALNAVMQAVQNPELAPEVRLEMQAVLYKFTDWLEQDSGLLEAGVLHQQMTHYWETGQWQAGFEVPALPPGSPI